MQIVMKLAGYDLGRSDLVRRAMSKKKADVMAKEREYFVYGNAELNVPGCIKNGIDEKTANKIFDEMVDFAKYAFNKSHAAAYTIVSYQTAYLKCYYPVEFMAALMTSVIENSSKVAEYIVTCRQMGIELLPPDINEGESSFSVSDGKIRYGLSAIKSIGKPVIQAIVREREVGGKYKSMKDFCERMSGREVNKRAVENFIKAGAFDSFGYTRRQQMMVYAQIMDQAAAEKKKSMTGQMSLFDFVSEEDKQAFEVKYPPVGEYDREVLLAYEKEVLGVYISGHPLEEYEKAWRKNITAVTTDFEADEETGKARVYDGQTVIVGGMITGKTIKTTKHNQLMAFITLEDLVGSVEIIVFPRDYEKNREFLNEEEKIYVRGRVSLSEDAQGKLICERVVAFSQIPNEIWIRFKDKDEFTQNESRVYSAIENSDGHDRIVIFCQAQKAIKRLPAIYNVSGDVQLIEHLEAEFGAQNIKIVQNALKMS